MIQNAAIALCSESVLNTSSTGLPPVSSTLRAIPSASTGFSIDISTVLGALAEATPLLSAPALLTGEAPEKSPWLVGSPRTEPLDTESDTESGQRVINHDSYVNAFMLQRTKAATRGQSLSRELRNPQIESVKKNLVIESCESILESFPLGAAILLRVSLTQKECGAKTRSRRAPRWPLPRQPRGSRRNRA